MHASFCEVRQCNLAGTKKRVPPRKKSWQSQQCIFWCSHQMDARINSPTSKRGKSIYVYMFILRWTLPLIILICSTASSHKCLSFLPGVWPSVSLRCCWREREATHAVSARIPWVLVGQREIRVGGGMGREGGRVGLTVLAAADKL